MIMKKPIFIVSFILSIVCAPVYTQSFLSLSSVPGGEITVNYGTAEVTPFKIGTYEITAGQWVSVMNWAIENGKLTPPSESSALTFKLAGNPLFDLDNRFCYIKYQQGQFHVEKKYKNYPAIGLNWYGAAAFCNFLSEKEGLSSCYNLEDFSCDYSQSGYRLPTNHEWELAARYKTDGTYWGKYDFSGSSQIDEVAWYKENSGQSPNASEYDGTQTHPVGTLKPNGLGIYDMSGNVNEWINDWYKGSYKPSGINPTGPASGKYRIIRGGSWASREHMCRVTQFINQPPHMWGSGGDTYLDIGFRVVRR